MDIVDGDNAAEIAGEQRGLTMTLLADERASERASELSELLVDRDFPYILLHTGPLFAHSLSFFLCVEPSGREARFVFVVWRTHRTPPLVYRMAL